MFHGSRQEFYYLVCSRCHSIYLESLPKDIGSFYKGYYSLKPLKLFNNHDIIFLIKRYIRIRSYRLLLLLVNFTPFIKIIWKYFLHNLPIKFYHILDGNLQCFLYSSSGFGYKILDVGAGTGSFLIMLKRLGFKDAIGIDPYLDQDIYWNNSLLVKKISFLNVTDRFDIIIFNHSLEHICNQSEILLNARRLLTPRGTIIVQLPNADSPELSKYFGNWWGLHAPFHISLPTRLGLEILCSNLKLKIIDTIYTSRAEHYLYSQEYEKNISAYQEGSFNFGGSACIWNEKDKMEASKIAFERNRNASGEIVAYLLAAV